MHCGFRLFQTDKDLKALFVHLVNKEDMLGHYEECGSVSNMPAVQLDELLLKKHAHVVMEALGAAVECLEDSVFLSTVLVALGQIHATYHVKPHYLPVSTYSHSGPIGKHFVG